MKRLFTLLSLLLLVVGTGMAQDVPTAGKTYVIQVVKNAGTAMSAPNLVLTTGTDKYIRAQALSTLTTAQKFTLETATLGNGAFNIKSVSNSQYLPSWYLGANGRFTTTASAGGKTDITYDFEAVEGTTNHYYLHGHAYNNATAATYLTLTSANELGVTKAQTSNTDNSKAIEVALYEVNDESAVVTKSYTVNCSNADNSDAFTYSLGSFTWIKGKPLTIEDVVPYYTLNSNQITINSFGDDQTLSATYTSVAFPFQISTSTDDLKWNYIRTRDKSNTSLPNCYLRYNGTNIISRNALTSTDLASIRDYYNDDRSQWAFVREANTYNTFTIYNKGAEGKVVYLANSNSGTAVTMVDPNSVTTGFKKFFITQSPSAFTAFSGFCIQPEDNSGHAIGDHGSSTLVYWSSRAAKDGTETNDQGSIFRIADLIDDCKSCATALSSGNYVGRLSTSATTTLNAQTTMAAFFTKYDELKTTDDFYVKPEAGKYYRITFKTNNALPYNPATANANGTVSTSDDSRSLTALTSSDADYATLSNSAATLVKFNANTNGTGYYIQNANSKFNWGSSREGANVALTTYEHPEWAGQYAIDYASSGTFTDLALKDITATNTEANYLYNAGSGLNIHSMTSNNAFDNSCAIKIQQVTTYPLTISAAGYASLCLPFSVTLPEGLTAYKVTGVADGGESRAMTMVALTGAVPAEEPIIVSGTAGTTYQLTINDADGTKSTDNILTGATVKRTGITEDYFALGYKALDASDADTKTAGFYKVTTQTMPANKAYLLRSRIPANTQQAAVLLFNFNGETTGIDAATTTTSQTEDNTLYDLNGRRVIYPTRGIYVRGNGQKVFIR